MKKSKAAGLDSAITAEALQNGGDAMKDILNDFCTEVFSTLIPPSQWTTNIIVPLSKKGNLSLTNYRGISFLSITAKMYNKILLNRIRDYVDPIPPQGQSGWNLPWKKLCPTDSHPQKDYGRFSRLSAPAYRYIHRL